METGFKFLFFCGVLLFSLIIVGIFVLALRILLIFYPELHIMGLNITSAL